MSTTSAGTIGIALFVAAFAPLLMAYRWPPARFPAVCVYALLLLGLAINHAGLSFGDMSEVQGGPSGRQAAAEPSNELLQRCNQALDAAERGALIRDRANPQQLVVDAMMWRRLPDEIKQAITRCVAITASEPEKEIEVVER